MISRHDVDGQRLRASSDKSDLFCMVREHKTNEFKFLLVPLLSRDQM